MPAGRYAKIIVQSATVGTSSSINIGASFWSLGGSAAVTIYPVNISLTGGNFALMITAPEFILTTGQSVTIGGSSNMGYTVREFNNP